MSINVIGISQNVLSVRLSGELTPVELDEFHRSIPGLLKQHGDFRILIRAEEFQGWGKGKWSSSGIQTQNDESIGKMAIVGDKKWEDLALLFTGQGLRRAQVEYFASADLAKATAWLGS